MVTWRLSRLAEPALGYQLPCDGFGIRPDRLHVTVFGGDEQVGPDTESLKTWEGLGVPVELTREENWWSNGPTGPCGPDSEIFVWTGETPPQGTPSSDPRWMEVWNHVMMRYRRHDDGSLESLRQSNVDTGMGLERMLMVLHDRQSVFDGEVFEPWMRTIPDLWELDEPSLRVTCDHLRSRRCDHRRWDPAIEHGARLRATTADPPCADHAMAE